MLKQQQRIRLNYVESTTYISILSLAEAEVY